MICRTLLFFVKQKTAYEVHISDWSSDVCSSDLHRIGAGSAGFHCTATSVMPEAMRAEPAMIPNAPVAMACALSALVGTAAASTGQPRYDVAQVVRVEPIVEYPTYPVQRAHCYQQPETVVAYAQPYRSEEHTSA